jgi:hypothetical protein
MWSYKAKWWEYPAFVLGSVLPYALWRDWYQRYRETAPITWEEWITQGREQLFNANTLVNHLILKNIAGDIIGKVTATAAVVGGIFLALKHNKASIFLLIWLATMPIYWWEVPNGNIVHDYYADIYIVPIVIAAAYGVIQIFKYTEKLFGTKVGLLGLAMFLLLSSYAGFRTSQYFFTNVSKQDLAVASEIKNIIPHDKKLVYLTGDAVPISIYHHTGWVLGRAPVDVDPTAASVLGLKNLGASYIVENTNDPVLPPAEMDKVRQSTVLVSHSPLVNIYKYSN